jgi:transcriptional regulator with XRE-family HTH domain
VEPGELLKHARKSAGLTQTQLAERLKTTQSVVARLESSRSNPRFRTLERAIAATGHAVESSLVPAGYPALDETLIAENLRLEPGERLQRFAGAYRSIRQIAPTVRDGS